MELLDSENRLTYNKDNIPRIKRFLDEMSGIPLNDVWTDISNIQRGEKVKYATQKPIKLLERLVSMFSNENDLVVDIFAGSGTTGVACLNLNRNYILIDINDEARNVFHSRINPR
jgi:DNA modification methylase